MTNDPVLISPKMPKLSELVHKRGENEWLRQNGFLDIFDFELNSTFSIKMRTIYIKEPS